MTESIWLVTWLLQLVVPIAGPFIALPYLLSSQVPRYLGSFCSLIFISFSMEDKIRLVDNDNSFWVPRIILANDFDL